jgi:hypothetical protein
MGGEAIDDLSQNKQGIEDDADQKRLAEIGGRVAVAMSMMMTMIVCVVMGMLVIVHGGGS